MNKTPNTEIARVLSFEPCIMYACIHPSGHDGEHEYRRCGVCGGLLFAELSDCERCSPKRCDNGDVFIPALDRKARAKR